MDVFVPTHRLKFVAAVKKLSLTLFLISLYFIISSNHSLDAYKGLLGRIWANPVGLVYLIVWSLKSAFWVYPLRFFLDVSKKSSLIGFSATELYFLLLACMSTISFFFPVYWTNFWVGDCQTVLDGLLTECGKKLKYTSYYWGLGAALMTIAISKIFRKLESEQK